MLEDYGYVLLYCSDVVADQRVPDVFMHIVCNLVLQHLWNIVIYE